VTKDWEEVRTFANINNDDLGLALHLVVREWARSTDVMREGPTFTTPQERTAFESKFAVIVDKVFEPRTLAKRLEEATTELASGAIVEFVRRAVLPNTWSALFELDKLPAGHADEASQVGDCPTTRVRHSFCMQHQVIWRDH
jgi:hypothetical protein